MRKRWIIGGAIILALVAGYAVYWHQVARILDQNLALWPEQWRARGYQVDLQRSEIRGFPWLLRSGIDRFEMRSPGPESWIASKQHGVVTLTGEPWRPLGFGIELAREQSWLVTDGLGNDLLRLFSNWGYGRVRIGFDGRLKIIAFEGQLAVKSAALPSFQIEEMRGWLAVDGESAPADQAANFSASLDLTDVEIDLPRDSPLGNRVTRLIVEGFATGELPRGSPRESFARWRDSGGVAEVTRLVVNWGPLAVTADATIALDQKLQPLIAGTAILRGYDQAIDAMIAGGLMSQGQGTTARIALAAIAQTDDGGGKVKLPITVQDGFLFLGPLKVAAVPRIVWPQ
ncbi:MAG: DUF2125 domain-containing protein [Dongiaceae bacterium]